MRTEVGTRAEQTGSVYWQFVEKTSNIAAIAMRDDEPIAVVERVSHGVVHAMLTNGEEIGTFSTFADAQRAIEGTAFPGGSALR